MFIIAIVLGTIIASAMVASRATSYNASILVSLTGDNPDLAAKLSGSNAGQGDRENTPARRKASRLIIWTQNTPDFLEEVVKNAQLDKRNPNKTAEELAKEVRKNLSEPTMLTDQYMMLKLTWPKPDEAEAILNALYSRFAEKTVSFETSTVTSLRQIIEEQFKSAEVKANALTRKRIAYQSTHYNTTPAMMSMMIGRAELSQTQLEDARLEQIDAQQRLADITNQLKGIPQEIVESRQEGGTTDNPLMQLSADYDDQNKKLKQLLTSYSSQHPKVIEMQKSMAALQGQIEETKVRLKHQPQAPKTKTSLITTSLNPEYRELNQQKRELARAVSAMNRRVSELQKTLVQSHSNIRVMPDTEIEWQRIDSQFQLADQIRKNRQAQLAQLTLDKERDEKTQQLQVKMEVPPKAEKADSGGKIVVLYALGPLLGIVIAFCFSLLVETLDHTLRTPVEVEKYLNKPVLAVIPRMQTPREGRKRLGGSSKSSISS